MPNLAELTIPLFENYSDEELKPEHKYQLEQNTCDNE